MADWVLDLIDKLHIESHISIGDILAFITILIGIYQFKRQAVINRKERELAQKESWFLQVIVEPQLSHLDGLYQKLIDDITRQRSELLRIRARGNNRDFYNKVARYKRENNQLIAKTFNHLEALVRSYSISLSSTLGNLVVKLRDINAYLIDNYNDHQNLEAIQISILKHEQAVLALLNKGLSINRY